MASWKIVPKESEEDKIEYTAFLTSRKFFAVDDSGSTGGSILKQERAFVDALRENFASEADAIALWGSNCDVPTKDFGSVRWTSDHGGTEPSKILTSVSALDTIKKSDVWFLLTDGEIWDADVHRLGDLAQEHDVLSAPLVLVITGYKGQTPSRTNISVGISFFASSADTLIVFKETSSGKIYIIAAKGCFGSLAGSEAAQNLESWDETPVFDNEASFFAHCKGLDIKIAKAETRPGAGRGVSLGAEWEEQQGGAVQVDVDLLLKAGRLSDEDLTSLLAEDAFDSLALAYKTRRRIGELRSFVQAQKVEQVAPELEDKAGAAAIIQKMGDATTTEEERKRLQQELREAHAKNREQYQQTVADFAGSPQEQALKTRNQLVDAALRSLASIEAASFNAEILSRKSNRARRAGVVESGPAIDMAKIHLDAPSYKGFCLVCCGEDEVMSICFKRARSRPCRRQHHRLCVELPACCRSSDQERQPDFQPEHMLPMCIAWAARHVNIQRAVDGRCPGCSVRGQQQEVHQRAAIPCSDCSACNGSSWRRSAVYGYSLGSVANEALGGSWHARRPNVC